MMPGDASRRNLKGEPICEEDFGFESSGGLFRTSMLRLLILNII